MNCKHCKGMLVFWGWETTFQIYKCISCKRRYRIIDVVSEEIEDGQTLLPPDL